MSARALAPLLVLTGPTGSGKSRCAQWLAERGALRIDADRVGHEALLEPAIAAALLARFGPSIRTGPGGIDRSALGRIVFADPAALADLESIVHPWIGGEIERRVRAARRTRAADLTVVDAALWWRLAGRLEADLVVHVDAPFEVRLRRIVERDRILESLARQRMERQRAVEASLDRADAVLDTADAPAAVRARLLALVDEHLGTALAATDPLAPPRT